MSYLDFSQRWNFEQFERFLEGFHGFKSGLGIIDDARLENLRIAPDCSPRLGFDFRLDDGEIKEFSARTYRGLAKAITHDKDVMLASVSLMPMSLKYACRSLRSDKDVVIAAINRDVFAIKHATEKARSEFDVAMAVVTQEPHLFSSVHVKFRDYDDIVWAAVEKDPRALRYASKRLLDDPKLVGFAVQMNPDVLRYASKRLRNDTSLLVRKIFVVEKEFAGEQNPSAERKASLDKQVNAAEKLRHDNNKNVIDRVQENIYR